MSRAADATPGAAGGEAGLALVELLVAMALLSLIALFMAQGIQSLRRMTLSTQRTAAMAELQAVRDHLRELLAETMLALPLGATAPFEGQATAARLVVPADRLLEVSGLSDVTLKTEPAGAALALVEYRSVARDDPAPAPSRTVLLEGIADLRLAYADTISGSLDWHSNWLHEGSAPRLIQVEITFPPGDPRRFAPLLVHPAAMATAGR